MVTIAILLDNQHPFTILPWEIHAQKIHVYWHISLSEILVRNIIVNFGPMTATAMQLVHLGYMKHL